MATQPDVVLSAKVQDQIPQEGSAGEAISFSPDQYKALQELAKSQNISLSEAVNQAIGIAKIVVSANQAKGERVLIQKGKQLQELTVS